MARKPWPPYAAAGVSHTSVSCQSSPGSACERSNGLTLQQIGPLSKWCSRWMNHEREQGVRVWVIYLSVGNVAICTKWIRRCPAQMVYSKLNLPAVRKHFRANRTFFRVDHKSHWYYTPGIRPQNVITSDGRPATFEGKKAKLKSVVLIYG